MNIIAFCLCCRLIQSAGLKRMSAYGIFSLNSSMSSSCLIALRNFEHVIFMSGQLQEFRKPDQQRVGVIQRVTL